MPQLPRRSQRIQARQGLDKTPSIVSKNSTKVSDVPKIRTSSTKLSQVSRREQVRIEMEMKKQELEHKYQQKMLDLELEMKLTTLEEDSESVGSESIKERPNIKNWVDGACPWDRSERHSQHSLKESLKVGST